MSESGQVETVFENGQKVHVYDEHENYIGFDGVIDSFEGEIDGVEIYRVEMPNGELQTLSEMRLGDA
ncbi:MAG TPA: hypothetical protein VFJ76_07875 [Solirubrobacterales bacterium]|nr:hypothetical protein [Solirubrobacterales bacterium]